jgi:hypothetical protein
VFCGGKVKARWNAVKGRIVSRVTFCFAGNIGAARFFAHPYNERMILNILISGFTQHHGYAHGWYKLREAMLAEGFSQGIAQRVWLEPWRLDFSRLADSVQILKSMYGSINVGVYGYSYGGGYGAVGLIWRLRAMGIAVRKCVLADPVFRPWWIPRPLPSPLSMLPRNYQPSILLPDNIVDLVHFYQHVSLPQSPYLISGRVQGSVSHRQLYVGHSQMDDHAEVHLAVLQSAAELRGDVLHIQSENKKSRIRKNAA